MTVVRSKAENLRLWLAGAYGNRLRVWRTVEAHRASGFPGRVALRYLGVGAGPCYYDLRPDELDAALADLVARGFDPALAMVNEAAPDDRVVAQGELFNGVLPDGSVDRFEFSTVRAQMREALRRERRAVSGLATRLLLRRLLTSASLEDLDRVLERFPDHVVEVSVYDGHLGDRPRRNALVWEVRRY